MPSKRKPRSGPSALPPNVADLLASEAVQTALDEAWVDSEPGNPSQRHEEGGWIYMNVTTGEIAVRRARAGSRAQLFLGNPPIIPGFTIVATFHTHPNPGREGWETGPSRTDERSAEHTGVPWIIRAEDGIHTTGPDHRRGGLGGSPGFPV